MGSCPTIPHPFPHSVVLAISADFFLLRLPPGLSTKGKACAWDVGLKSVGRAVLLYIP